MKSKPNRIVTVTTITLLLFVLIAISAIVLRLNRNLIGGVFHQVPYSIALPVFLVSAMMFLAGILLFDFIYLRILIESRSKKILLILYYCVIYTFRLFSTIIIVFGVFDFYLINSDYELSEKLQNICFYYFPLISPIVISIILIVHNKIISRQINKNNVE